MTKQTIRGIQLERALEMHPRRVDMPDVLKVIKNKKQRENCELYYINDYIEEVALFSSENFNGAVYILYHNSEYFGYDTDYGSLHYQLGAVYFDKRTAKELILPESINYLYYPKTWDYSDCGRHSIYLQQLPEDKLKIELCNRRHSRDPRPKFKAICNVDLAKKVIAILDNAILR